MTSLDTALARFTPVEAAPITDAELRARIASLQGRMQRAAISAVWLDASSSLAYFTGLSLGFSERIHGALIPARGEITYVSPTFEVPKLRTLLRLPGAIAQWEEDEDPFALIAGLAGGPLAVDPSTPFRFVTGLMAAGAHVVPAQPLIVAGRQIKSRAELALIQTAMDASLEEAQIARAMIRNARSVTILADAGKFGRQAAYAVCGTGDIDLIISDSQLDKAHRDAMRDRGIELWT